LYDSAPFRAFVMHLADGRSIPVWHREFLLSAPSGKTLVVFQPDDLMNIVDINLVTDLEIKPEGVSKRHRKRLV
jgi:ABC-type taurine transport system ATPase subunit